MTEKAAQEAANAAETKVKGTMVRILRWINGRISHGFQFNLF